MNTRYTCLVPVGWSCKVRAVSQRAVETPERQPLLLSSRGRLPDPESSYPWCKFHHCPYLRAVEGSGKMELAGFLSALFSVNFGNEVCVSQVLLGVAVMNIFGNS